MGLQTSCIRACSQQQQPDNGAMVATNMLSPKREYQYSQLPQELYVKADLPDVSFGIDWSQLTILNYIGCGVYGTVWEAEISGEREHVAVKIVSDETRWCQEVVVLRALAPHAHRYILRVWAAGKCSALTGRKLHNLKGEKFEDFDNVERWFIVTELLAGMDLYERVTTGPPVVEQVAARWFYDMVQALKVCHTHNFAHRELKASNFVLTSTEDSRAHIKLVDFGFAEHLDKSQKYFPCGGGNIYYTSPELLEYENGLRSELSALELRGSDVWALSVTLYFILSGGRQLFRGRGPLGTPEHASSTLERIRGASIDLEVLINTQAKDLLRRLLQRDPLERPTFEQVLKHPWIAFRRLKRIPLAA